MMDSLHTRCRRLSWRSIVAITTVCVGMLMSSSMAQASSTTIHVEKGPWGAAVDSATGTVYVTNSQSNTVSVISEATKKVTATIPVGGNPQGLAIDPTTDTIYVANFISESVSVISGATNTVTATIAKTGLYPLAVAVNAATDTVYVGTYFGSTVDVINGATNVITTEVPLPGANIHDVAVDPATETVYASAYNLGYVAEISTNTNTVTRELTGLCGPDGLGIDESSDTLLVAENFCLFGTAGYSSGPKSGGIPDLDEFVPTKGETAAFFLAPLAPSGGLESVEGPTSSTAGTVQEIIGGKVKKSFAVGVEPRMLDIDPATKEVFTPNFGSESVTEFKL